MLWGLLGLGLVMFRCGLVVSVSQLDIEGHKQLLINKETPNIETKKEFQVFQAVTEPQKSSKQLDEVEVSDTHDNETVSENIDELVPKDEIISYSTKVSVSMKKDREEEQIDRNSYYVPPSSGYNQQSYLSPSIASPQSVSPSLSSIPSSAYSVSPSLSSIPSSGHSVSPSFTSLPSSGYSVMPSLSSLPTSAQSVSPSSYYPTLSDNLTPPILNQFSPSQSSPYYHHPQFQPQLQTQGVQYTPGYSYGYPDLVHQQQPSQYQQQLPEQYLQQPGVPYQTVYQSYPQREYRTGLPYGELYPKEYLTAPVEYDDLVTAEAPELQQAYDGTEKSENTGTDGRGGIVAEKRGLVGGLGGVKPHIGPRLPGLGGYGPHRGLLGHPLSRYPPLHHRVPLPVPVHVPVVRTIHTNHLNNHDHVHKHTNSHSHKHNHSEEHKHKHDEEHNHVHRHTHHHDHHHNHKHRNEHTHDEHHKHGHKHQHGHDHGHKHGHQHVDGYIVS